MLGAPVGAEKKSIGIAWWEFQLEARKLHGYLKANWLCCNRATRSDGGRKEVVRQRKVDCGCRGTGAAETE